MSRSGSHDKRQLEGPAIQSAPLAIVGRTPPTTAVLSPRKSSVAKPSAKIACTGLRSAPASARRRRSVHSRARFIAVRSSQESAPYWRASSRDRRNSASTSARPLWPLARDEGWYVAELLRIKGELMLEWLRSARASGPRLRALDRPRQAYQQLYLLKARIKAAMPHMSIEYCHWLAATG